MALLLDQSHDERHCQSCGSKVSESFRRVFGDDDDVAHRCRRCDSDRRIGKGSAAGQNVDVPERSEPGRHGANGRCL
ncbi:DUF7563 family protein [Haloprofundus halobius]|uniref:DUF7563 family protein n=1 Tax=Haloprofundus halobius TaxID=2876194 RepID=UPI001CCBB3DA